MTRRPDRPPVHSSTPEVLQATRAALHRVAIHVVARARVQATGRFSLRVAPGGFGTPEFGDALRRVRVSGGVLVVEHDEPGGASATTLALDGATLADLAAVAQVDLTAPLDIGRDTTTVGPVDSPLVVDESASLQLADWFQLAGVALDALMSVLPASAEPSSVRLWPEHFDVALDAAARDGLRVNFGGSAGDGFHAQPYLYVGPTAPDRPGGGKYWNAPFGALRAADSVPDVGTAVEFFTEGLHRLRR